MCSEDKSRAPRPHRLSTLMLVTALSAALMGCRGTRSSPSPQPPDETAERLTDLMRRIGQADDFKCKESADELRQMGSRARLAVPLLIKCLDSKDPFTKTAVASALGEIGDVTSVDSLRRLLKDQEDYVRSEAARALGQIGPGAVAAVPDLLAAASPDLVAAANEEEFFRYQHSVGMAIKALSMIGKPAVPALVKALESEETLEAAAQALGGMGSMIVPTLAEALPRGGNASVGAAAAIQWLGPDGAPLVEALLRAFEEGKIDATKLMIAVTRIGPGAKDAVPVLVRLLRQSSSAEQLALAQTLRAIGPPSVAALKEALAAEQDKATRAKIEGALRFVQQ